MIARRQMLGTGVLGGLVAAALPPEAGTADMEQAPERDIQAERERQAVANAVDKLTAALKAQRTFDELTAVRDAQRAFLRANAKYPDFMEVGVDIWQTVYDWHVKWQQPMSVGRDSAGRYTLIFMFTTLILRPDMTGAFMGVPYDVK